MTKDLPTITIDGRTHEGGGQILRLAAGLSAITGKAITITNIRAGRVPTGLRGSHVEAIKCLKEMSASEAQGVELGSESVVFHPACPVSSSSSQSSTTSRSSKTTKGKKPTKGKRKFLLRQTSVNSPSTNPEAPVVISRKQTGTSGSSTELERQITITQKTNGASFLIFQAIYPYLLARARRPISVRIIGGTNMRSAPSLDYVEQVLLPNFAKFGLPPASVYLHKRGWDTGPYDLGDVTVEVQPLPLVIDDNNDNDSDNDAYGKSPLRPVFPEIDLNRYGRGRIKSIQITVLAPDDPVLRNTVDGPGFDPDVENTPPRSHNQADKIYTAREYLEYQTYLQIRKRLLLLPNDLFVGSSDIDGGANGFAAGIVSMDTYKTERTYHPTHMYVLVVAEMDNGFRIGVDGAGSGTRLGSTRRLHDTAHVRMGIAKELAETCIRHFVDEISMARFDSGGRKPCVDQNMRDQMVVFEALSPAPSSRSLSCVEVEDPRYWSSHTRTAKWVCEKILGSEPE
ncbi:hypothetical protein P168DRAFT_302571 [Aspergillus campestris IBT 28561]|uniref:RNA 3'-terminal phosphate cyclase domain-containing protein n=1 Tax=Aspergillus campestris (strain IBT 28561) TaxID=1392248 RepID=A0A2I1D8K8_ASPC2|nr:uncharacterized protein P168DRAFT_302571 [Aspergillus campestris IBT 28561]PKY06188.1 hypothetical protein P168DRAFT_302571 [Aspergillus campestris IBT 28561]